MTPWVIVLLHAPWYNTNEAHEGEGESMREAMESLLFNARVDVVFAGHVHAYERFVSTHLHFSNKDNYITYIKGELCLMQKRVYNNKADQCGPIYITIGDGGNREGLATSYVTFYN